MSNIVMAFIISGLLLVSWWFEMFSDSGFGQMARAMNKKGRYGKNVIALMVPAIGSSFLVWAIALIVESVGFSELSIDVLGYVALVLFAIGLVGLFSIPLPRWMYPEYHLAKRERLRAEKLARGEAVKMPSSGRVAVEAQRLEQALRRQSDKNE
ncbi:hypothetical protein [Schaalia sp. Marseille-Q2122]|uniref:hypothetical protein n=1 Tax=Schaalia sp. Marseille-Q2122 TaxID=2736604 RepID=UPI0015893A31|nr:hypothetical protein [Schaalia sp. Marseille-Q2122]